MNKKQRKIKMNIKGRFKKFWSDYMLKHKTQNLKVNVHDLTHHSGEHIELTVSGEMHRLWEVVSWSKKGAMFFAMNEIMVEFVD
jgi:hypothetical protein